MPHPFIFDHLIPTLDAAKIQLESLDLNACVSSLATLSSASCLTSLKRLKTDLILDRKKPRPFQLFTQSPILSNLETLILGDDLLSIITSAKLVSLLSSSMMSNNLVELDLACITFPTADLIKTLCTQHTIPHDNTSPLKYGKLRQLDISMSHITDDDVALIVENLTQLTHLNVSNFSFDCNITDKTIIALLSTEKADPRYQYPSLPNLVNLNISSCQITAPGFIELSKSQLLDQLEELHLRYCPGLYSLDHQPFSPSLYALLTTPHVSHLQTLVLSDGMMVDSAKHKAGDMAIEKYLDNCHVSWE